MFDAEDDANNLLKEAQKNIGANIVNMNFCNQEGNLKPDRVGLSLIHISEPTRRP